MTESIYFDAFCKKDIKTLSRLYTDDIVLNEWNENIFTGKEDVLQANRDLFSAFNTIDIKVIRSVEHTIPNIEGSTAHKVIYAEIEVYLDDMPVVKVIDVIHFRRAVEPGSYSLISRIDAYRGF